MDMIPENLEEDVARINRRNYSFMQLYEIREIQIKSCKNAMNYAKREGKIEIARNMLNEGLSLDIIHRVTGIDTKNIQSL
jgi:predicted transposase/invertase (TIGR01784 family)